jgi:hypothetical protein
VNNKIKIKIRAIESREMRNKRGKKHAGKGPHERGKNSWNIIITMDCKKTSCERVNWI